MNDTTSALSPREEPEAHGAPLRRFTDPSYVPLCASLAEVREHIDAIDQQIVALLAERGRYVKDAARFKRDAFQVSAPQRQLEVIEKVKALAKKEGAYPEVVEACYLALIEGFIAREQQDHQGMIDAEAQP
ncbi:chorismate mutase [Variovorax gossypii]|uniref:chorismate mutase n=1 Tax=Variovorax gossypii TaxID=1679495 RepID=A0A431TPY0_9BURK|nr:MULTISPECIES: chorismate mutase [Variovorax]MDR6522081.1 isochorismate pyruvate lyase [Variovorax paradoxus]RTQ35608.1 chorismate mutase [Variovorax gossypii]